MRVPRLIVEYQADLESPLQIESLLIVFELSFIGIFIDKLFCLWKMPECNDKIASDLQHRVDPIRTGVFCI